MIVFSIPVKFIYSFGYGRIAQIHWQKESRECGGYLQSPISINSSMAVEIGMPALETIRYRNMLPEEVTLQNNGHSSKSIYFFTIEIHLCNLLIKLIILSNYKYYNRK